MVRTVDMEDMEDMVVVMDVVVGRDGMAEALDITGTDMDMV